MKLRIDDFEVDVKVRFPFEERANVSALLYFLNEISVVYTEASERMNELHPDSIIAKGWKQTADQLYEFCKKRGAYGSYEEE